MMYIKHVLIIEDSLTQAQEYALNLEKDGYEPIIAESGILGLNFANQYKPFAIVLDVNLPDINGFQVCRRLKRDPDLASIPVIMLTAEDSAISALDGLDAGADDYIPKDDFAIENLRATLRNLAIDPSPGGG